MIIQSRELSRCRKAIPGAGWVYFISQFLLAAMKKYFLLNFLFFSTSLSAVFPQDDIEILRELIIVTKKNLDSEQKLLKILLDFQEARHAFIEDPTSGRLATKLVKISMSLQKKLEEEHLEHLFSPDLLVEIGFFSKVGQNQKISS